MARNGSEPAKADSPHKALQDKKRTPERTSSGGSREAKLKRYGRLYGELRLAIAFTESIKQSDTKDPKRSRAWKVAEPLSSANAGAELLGKRGKRGNPVVNLRASGLVGIESDTPDDLRRIQELGLPETVTVQSSEDYRRHFWYRPPGESEYCAFRFEKDKIKADRERYFLVPPARHPSGANYTFIQPPGKSGSEIATLSQDQYDALVELAKGRPQDDHDQDPEPLDVNAILAGASKGERDESAYKYACSMRARNFQRGEALALMEAAHAAMEQPAGDEYRLEAALEKVHRAWREFPPGTGSQRLVSYERPAELRAEAFHGIAG
jgi:Bifunctional DNA primase/polymerase, N-terminal